MSTRELNVQRKMLKCLKCNRLFKTDRCHRICSKCKKAMFHQRDSVRVIYVDPIDMHELAALTVEA